MTARAEQDQVLRPTVRRLVVDVMDDPAWLEADPAHLVAFADQRAHPPEPFCVAGAGLVVGVARADHPHGVSVVRAVAGTVGCPAALGREHLAALRAWPGRLCWPGRGAAGRRAVFAAIGREQRPAMSARGVVAGRPGPAVAGLRAGCITSRLRRRRQCQPCRDASPRAQPGRLPLPRLLGVLVPRQLERRAAVRAAHCDHLRRLASPAGRGTVAGRSRRPRLAAGSA